MELNDRSSVFSEVETSAATAWIGSDDDLDADCPGGVANLVNWLMDLAMTKMDQLQSHKEGFP